MNTMHAMSSLRRESILGLVWMTWRRHRAGYLLGLPSIALMAFWIGLVENAGGPMFLWVGLIMAVSCGAGFGRSESSEGAEEYSFSLPALRRDRYYVRVAFGVAFLSALMLLGLAAGPFGWVRAVGELLPIELPEYRSETPIWSDFNAPGFYLLSIGATFAVFAEVYALTVNAERSCNSATCFVKLAPFAIGALLVVLFDTGFFSGSAGYLSGGLGLAYAVPRTHFGCKKFERKSANFNQRDAKSVNESNNTLMAIVLALTVLFTTAVWVYFARR